VKPRGLLPAGKLPAALLRRLLRGAGQTAGDVLLAPMPGEDAAVIEVEAGALVAATDPITLTGQDVGAHAVVINANDVAVTGARPRWFLATLLLPVGSSEDDLSGIFDGMHAELARLGAVLVGGHTEITAAVTQPVVVGQMLGLREDGRYVRTGGVCPGHVIVQIGPAPIEGAGVLATEAAERLSGVDPALLDRAARAIRDPGICVVDPALLCCEIGATAMHDPTEGGLSAGLHEMAEASGVALEIDAGAVLWFEPGMAICRAVGADPWGTLASGCLLAAFEAEAVGSALPRLGEAGFSAARIGVARTGSGVRLEAGAALPRYERDELSRVLSG
jgi:hydrogenase maturation factor